MRDLKIYLKKIKIMSKVVLVVDDLESIREMIAHFLIINGYEVIKADDGTDALKYTDGREIDLILTDLHMPKMNGIEFIKRVRQIDKYKYIPIMFLTTETQMSIKMEAKNAGATGWLVKPFKEDKLINVIKKVLR